MKRVFCLLAAGVMSHLAASGTGARQSPEYDMGVMQMVLLRAAGSPKGAGDLLGEHRARVAEMVKAGQCALAAEAGGGGINEILVFKTQTREEIDRVVASLPAVKSGLLKAETLAWFAARNFIRKPTADGKSSNYVFGLLVRGPNWTAERTPETEKIQKGHMENIGRLHNLGKLVLAGPFENGGDRRGVFFFKVETAEEAKALADTDPAIIAGRLKIELLPIKVATGILQ